MLRTVYEALTAPERMIGVMELDGFATTAQKDQLQAYLRDILETGMVYGAQESIGAMRALAANEEENMKQADYGHSFGHGEPNWEGLYTALKTDVDAVKASVQEYLEESDGEEKELAEVVLEWLGEVGR